MIRKTNGTSITDVMLAMLGASKVREQKRKSKRENFVPLPLVFFEIEVVGNGCSVTLSALNRTNEESLTQYLGHLCS